MASNSLKKAAATTEDTLRALVVITILGAAAIYLSKGKHP